MKDEFLGYLVDQGFSVELAKIITCQAAHESNFFTSRLARENKNFFGIKGHNRRVQGKYEGIKHGYSHYENYQGSINDIIDWLERYFKTVQIDTINEYVVGLHQRGYFEDTPENYERGMNNAYKKLFP